MIKRIPILIAILLMAAGLAMLVHIKHKVQHLQSDLVELERQVHREEDAIHVLQAEWSYLTTPERLRQLSEKYLSVDTIQVAQVRGSMENMIMLAEKAEDHVSIYDMLEDEPVMPTTTGSETAFFAPVSEVRRLFERP